MATSHRPSRGVPVNPVAALVIAALVVGACGSSPGPSGGEASAPASAPAAESAAPPATAAPATPVPTASPVPTATPAPVATPAPTASPAPTATPAPTPSAAPTTTIDDWVWTYEKRPLSVKGTAGVTIYPKVLFGAKTVSLTWTAKPAASAGCTFRYKVESSSLAKAVAGSQKIKGTKAVSGKRSLTPNYGDGVLTVTTDCATWSLKAVSTGHPGLTIKQANDPFKASGTTADELNEALAESYADWSINTRTKYYSGGTIRVSSFTAVLDIDYVLPTWAAPEGTSQDLVDAWNVALKNMRRHTEGEAAIGIQAAGKYLAASTKKTFPSISAMNKYRDKLSDKWIDWASDKTDAYNEATQYGVTQGAFIE